jgi:DNA-binding beta-propeller fold protein YncE
MTKPLLIILVIALMLLASAPASFATTKSNQIVNAPGATSYCGGNYFPTSAVGIYSIKGGAILLTGDGYLFFCTASTISGSIASPPTAPADYSGLAGIQTTAMGTVLVILNGNFFSTPPGFWLCEGATKTGCKTESKFYSVPSSFCSKFSGGCFPQEVAIDSKLNVYYTDPNNGVVVKCTHSSSYKSCSVKETLSGKPFGIYLNPKNGDLWVTDFSCLGTVWKNGALQVQYGDSLEGITVSSNNPQHAPHVYFATTGSCIYGFAHIFDFTDKDIVLPMGQPFSSPGDIYDISTSLLFVTYNGPVGAYAAHDA